MSYKKIIQIVLLLSFLLHTNSSVLFSSDLLGGPGPVMVKIDSRVNSCLVLPNKQKLVGTHSGLLLLKNDYSLIKAWNGVNGLPGTRVYSIILLKNLSGKKKTTVLIGTEKGLAIFTISKETYSLKTVFKGADIRLLFEFRSKLYAGTWGDGLFKLDKNYKPIKIEYSESDKAKSKYRITSYLKINNTFYISTAGSGIYEFKKNNLVPLNINPKLPSTVVFAMAEYKNNLWVGTLAGLVKINNGTVISINNSDIRTFSKKDKILYAGSFTKGVLKFTSDYNPQKLNPLKQSKNINSLIFDNNKIIACSNSGIWVKSNKNFKKIKLTIPFSKDITALTVDEKKGLWIGTFDQGLYYLNKGKLTEINKPDLDKKINALAYEPDGSRLWIGTTKGLFLLKKGKIIHYTKSDGLASNNVLSLTTIKSGGVLAGLGKSAVIVNEEHIIPLGDKEKIPNRGVFSVLADKTGNLWMGTTIGLFRYGTNLKNKRYSVAGGHFKNGWITALKIHGNRIWVGTYNSGISGISLSKDKDVKHLGGGFINPSGICFYKNYLYAATMSGLKRIKTDDKRGKWETIKNGAPGKDVTAIVPMDYSLWIGSRRGLSRIYPNKSRN